MSADRAPAIERLLLAAADAHHVYERETLRGIYDEAWPAWYGQHIVAHGLATIIGRPVTDAEAGHALHRAWETYRHLDPKPAEDWAVWTARHLAGDL